MIQIYIPLSPQSWKAPIRGKNGFYDLMEKEKRSVRFIIKDQYSKDLIRDFVALEFKFLFKVPESSSVKRKAKMLEGALIPTRSDCTNLQKLYEDCLKGIVIEDDRNVAKIFSEKLYAEKEGIYIKVFTLEEYEKGKRE